MSKQEEIREVLELWNNGDCLYRDVECENRCKDPITHQHWCRVEDSFYDCLLRRLDEIGAVIKVDREIPLPSFENTTVGVERFNLQLDIRKKMIEAGCVAVGSLIEDKNTLKGDKEVKQ